MERRWEQMGAWARSLNVEQLRLMVQAAEHSLVLATGFDEVQPARQHWEDVSTVLLDLEHLLSLSLDQRESICCPAAQPIDGESWARLDLYESKFCYNPAFNDPVEDDGVPHSMESPVRKRSRGMDEPSSNATNGNEAYSAQVV